MVVQKVKVIVEEKEEELRNVYKEMECHIEVQGKQRQARGAVQGAKERTDERWRS